MCCFWNLISNIEAKRMQQSVNMLSVKLQLRDVVIWLSQSRWIRSQRSKQLKNKQKSLYQISPQSHTIEDVFLTSRFSFCGLTAKNAPVSQARQLTHAQSCITYIYWGYRNKRAATMRLHEARSLTERFKAAAALHPAHSPNGPKPPRPCTQPRLSHEKRSL